MSDGPKKDWPVHGRITGPFSKRRPCLSARSLWVSTGSMTVKRLLSYSKWRSMLTEGGGQGFCVNLSVDTSSRDILELCRELGALYIDTVAEPTDRFTQKPWPPPSVRSGVRTSR
jgi:homospermidine synthase